MTTREEIEAALLWYSHDDGSPLVDGIQHLNTLAGLYFEYRAERQRRIEAAAAEIWRRIPGDFVDVGEICDIITRCMDGETT